MSSECMFEDYESWPAELTAVFAKYDELIGISYPLCEQITKELNAVGYTVDYGLSGDLYNLRPLAPKIGAAQC